MRYFTKQIQNKLFLCSNDLKAGDAAFVEDEYAGQHKPTQVIDVLEHDGSGIPVILSNHREIYRHAVYKVIGEVSPGAFWVKEGDRFDDDRIEIEQHLIQSDDSISPVVTKPGDMSPRCKYAPVCIIKCHACGTFH